MKNKICILLGLLTLAVVFAGCAKERSYNVTAQVLSINENILQGQMIGAFLSSPFGNFSNDIIKVGVFFSIQNEEPIFVDLELLHSELTYYEEVDEIPLKVCLYDYYENCWKKEGWTQLQIYLHDRLVIQTTRYQKFPNS